jgi:isopentenyl-diphosphate delta-isomerase
VERGLLHRAFSVFLFNTRGELLLQRRAASKITFPHRWANTCCSHPLFTPAELETAGGLGVKRAAVRKLQQELGIPAEDLQMDDFVLVGRVHYSAEDKLWGEHEIDHILVCCPRRDVRLLPNANEVAETSYVRRDEMPTWMDAHDAFLSPWFRGIATNVLPKLWDAVEMHRRLQATDAESAHALERHVGPLRDMTILRLGKL